MFSNALRASNATRFSFLLEILDIGNPECSEYSVIF